MSHGLVNEDTLEGRGNHRWLGLRDVLSRRAVDFPCDLRLEHDHRDSARHRLEWCEPKPFILRQKGKHRGARVERRELSVGDVMPRPNTIARRGPRDERVNV